MAGWHEILAVAHLFIASEALTPIALAELERTSLDRGALAAEWSVEPQELDAAIRRRLTFRGDDAIYTSVKNGSDGFEHSLLDFDRVRLLSRDVRDTAADYLRNAILEHSRLEQSHRATLESPPRDTASGTRVSRTR